MMIRCIVVGGLMLLGCASDDRGCPSKLATASAHWQSTGGDPDCAELAAALNAESTVFGGGADDSECAVASAWMVEEADGQCTAALASACDGFTLDVACKVQASGAADCDAAVSGEGLACRLRLQLR